MSLLQRDEVTRLKSRARKALGRFRAISAHYDCGAAMLKHMNPKAAAAAEEFNTAMTQLAALDPACPKWEAL